MEKYLAPKMEVVEFDMEDIITTSGGQTEQYEECTVDTEDWF